MVRWQDLLHSRICEGLLMNKSEKIRAYRADREASRKKREAPKPTVLKKGYRTIEALFGDRPYYRRGTTCP